MNQSPRFAGSWLGIWMLIALISVPAAAHAHQRLLRTTPAADDTLSTVPTELRLTFNQPVELALAEISLLGPGGEIALGELRTARDSAQVLIGSIQGPLAPGGYTVRWRVTSSDGHPVRGEYGFVIAEDAAGLSEPTADSLTASGMEERASPPESEPGSSAVSEGFGVESPLYAAVRWLFFLGLLALIGAVSFRFLVLHGLRTERGATAPVVESAQRNAARIGLAAALVLIVALGLRLYAQSVAVSGAAEAWDTQRLSLLLWETRWGWGWLLQSAGALLALLGFALARRPLPGGWAIALLAALVLSLSAGLSGHAAAVERGTVLAVLADGLHVLGAGGWLGSLLCLVLAGLPAALSSRTEDRTLLVSRLVNAFSITALLFAGLVVATGVFAAWLHLGDVAALWNTGYGRTLLLKLAALTLVFGTGAFNWLRVRPALARGAGIGKLRRSSGMELAVGVLVLAITAVLVATPPPGEDPGPRTTASQSR